MMRLKRPQRWVLALMCLLPVSGALLAAQPVLPTAIPGLTHVLVISLDGARPDAILQAQTPYLRALAERGAADWSAQTVFPPATLPAHASLLTGLAVADHGVNFNATQINCPAITAPTFLTLAETAGYRMALVTGKEKFCHFRQTEALDYTFARVGDRSVVDRVLDLLDADYEVIFAHFPNPDFFGHSAGWMSALYISELSSTDAQLGRILDRLDELELTASTLVIVTADHGGHGFVHGSDIPDDMTIPWIIAGPGVMPGLELEGMGIADTAATVAWALGLEVPDGWDGEPALAAFELGADTVWR